MKDFQHPMKNLKVKRSQLSFKQFPAKLVFVLNLHCMPTEQEADVFFIKLYRCRKRDCLKKWYRVVVSSSEALKKESNYFIY